MQTGFQRHQQVAVTIAAVVGVAGFLAAVYYTRAGLALAHYDARAHLVVARRILDSLTPGWQQIGAVWLPLPHVLNMLPVQIDAWYRTGASAIAISVLSMMLAAGSLASLLVRTTGSIVAAAAGGALLIMNPNVLYLQSTPMTEPLLFGLSLFSVATMAGWLDAVAPPAGVPVHPDAAPRARHWAGMALAAACLTRYEAWAITAALLALAALVLLRRGAAVSFTVRQIAALALWPAVAIVIFSMNSRWTVGDWFVSGGFFVPENVEALGRPLVALEQVHQGLLRLAGNALSLAGYGGAALVLWTSARSSVRAPLLLLIALLAAAALPVAAYTEGHPFRIRYDLPLVIACGALAAAAIAALPPLARAPLGLVLLAVVAWESPPLDRSAPLLVESQRDAQNMLGRRAITAHLEQHYDGRTIMMSMGSLAHYMHDLSHAGFRIKDFLHEGNDEIWTFAMLRPRGHAGWLIIEGSAEGGDALHHAAQRPRWLEGFEQVAEGGGARLYRAR